MKRLIITGFLVLACAAMGNRWENECRAVAPGAGFVSGTSGRTTAENRMVFFGQGNSQTSQSFQSSPSNMRIRQQEASFVTGQMTSSTDLQEAVTSAQYQQPTGEVAELIQLARHECGDDVPCAMNTCTTEGCNSCNGDCSGSWLDRMSCRYCSWNRNMILKHRAKNRARTYNKFVHPVVVPADCCYGYHQTRWSTLECYPPSHVIVSPSPAPLVDGTLPPLE